MNVLYDLVVGAGISLVLAIILLILVVIVIFMQFYLSERTRRRNFRKANKQKVMNALQFLYERGARFVLCVSDKDPYRTAWPNLRPTPRKAERWIHVYNGKLGVVPASLGLEDSRTYGHGCRWHAGFQSRFSAALARFRMRWERRVQSAIGVQDRVVQLGDSRAEAADFFGEFPPVGGRLHLRAASVSEASASSGAGFQAAWQWRLLLRTPRAGFVRLSLNRS